MKQFVVRFIYFFLLTFFFSSCEEEYVPSDVIYEKQYVIESYIELSNADIPVYALVTYSLPFYSSLGIDVINNSFIRSAIVTVSDGSTDYPLQELCLNDLSEPFRSEVIKNLGYEPDSIRTNICIYADIGRAIKPEVNKEYRIQVVISKDTISGKTIIPGPAKIDSFWFVEPPGKNKNDTFAQMLCIIEDPPGVKDFYRYFTAGQNERLIANVNSVTDDTFFEGQKFKFPLSKALGPDEKFGDNTGYFRRGDTVQIKWCTLSESHFNFWNTLETSRTRQGPFASYVRINGNIEKGLGIFGAQNCQYYTLVVPRI